MKYLLILLFSLSMMFLMISCENSTQPADTSPKTGDLFIEVFGKNQYNNSSIPIANAKVIIKGTDFISYTNGYGQVTFRDVPSGEYEVLAYIEKKGSGKTFATVEAGKKNKVEIIYYAGLLTEPVISLHPSYTYSNVALFDTLLITGVVSDNETLLDSLTIDVSVDYQFHSSIKPENDGTFEFRYLVNQKDSVKISFKVTDQDSLTGADSLKIYAFLPQRSYLKTSEVVNKGVKLEWTKCLDPDFAYYKLVQSSSDGNVNYTFYDRNITSVTDTMLPFVTEVNYKIYVHDFAGNYSVSPYYKIQNPIGKIIAGNPIDAVIHPNEPILYIISNYSSSYDFSLMAYNYETKKILKQILLSDVSGKITIGDNGNGIEIYIPLEPGDIAIYDPSNLELIKKIETGFLISSIAIDGNKHIFSYFSNHSANRMRVFHRDTGDMINQTGYSQYANVVLKKVPNKNLIIGTDYSAGKVIYFEFNSDCSSLQAKTTSVNYSNPFEVSNTGKYFAVGEKGRLYDVGDSPSFIAECSNSAYLKFRCFNFSADDKYIFAADYNRTIMQYGVIPELKSKLLTISKGITNFMFYREKLILITKEMGSSQSMIVETIDI